MRLLPEGLPWPFSLAYNRLSASGVFQRQYELVAADVRAEAPGPARPPGSCPCGRRALR